MVNALAGRRQSRRFKVFEGCVGTNVGMGRGEEAQFCPLLTLFIGREYPREARRGASRLRDRIQMKSRSLASQHVEMRIACRILNRMTRLGMPDSYRVA